ncbi:hypothetical protein AOLI_G00225310 [Acnodon oligacanthus]
MAMLIHQLVHDEDRGLVMLRQAEVPSRYNIICISKLQFGRTSDYCESAVGNQISLVDNRERAEEPTSTNYKRGGKQPQRSGKVSSCCDVTSRRSLQSCIGQNKSGSGGSGRRRKDFFRDPFKYARQLLDEKRSGKLIISKEDLEQYIKGQYMDEARDTPLGSPGYIPHPDLPKTLFDTSPPRLCEIREALQKARSGSAPGPNGLPYKLYKACP